MNVTSPFLRRYGIAIIAALSLVAAPACKKQTDGDAAPPNADADADDADARDDSAPEDDGDEDGDGGEEGNNDEDSPYLNTANFAKTVASHEDEQVACYNDTAGKDASPPTGRVKVIVGVNGDGEVTQVIFDQRSDFTHDGLNACLEKAIKAWKFPIGVTDMDTPLPHTFEFSKDGLLK